ncbi:MAG: tetratricopeptide repeat protein [Bacteroidota bacterium]
MRKKVLSVIKNQGNLSVFAAISAILLLTFLIYLPSLHGQFLDYDDTGNVLNNALIRQFSPGNLWMLLSMANLYMYTPLTFISYAFDYALYGPDPFYFKLTNLFLHLLNAVLLYYAAFRLFNSRFQALFVALLFAVHPMNVDSVSWISARSNLLSAAFFILSLIFYISYIDRKKLMFLLLATLSFFFSLMAKPAGIMLPVILFLVDYLKRRKFSRAMVLEKLPLFILSAAFAVATIHFRSDTGNPGSMVGYNAADRLFMGCYATLGYLFHTLVPWHLSAVYAYPQKNGNLLPSLFYVAPAALALLFVLVSKLKMIRREAIFGFLFFLVTLVVTQATLLEDGFMANRYGYLPLIGIFFILAMGMNYCRSCQGLVKKACLFSMAPLLVLFSVITWQRSQVWEGNLSLFDDVVKNAPGSAFGYNNRGIARYTANDMEGALSDYNQAILLNPRYSGAYYNRGIVNYSLKEVSLAEKDYSRAIRLNPGFASCYMARGILEMDATRNDSLALADYNAALRINPGMAQAYFNRGILYLRMGAVQSACEDFHQVRRLGYDRADDLIRQYCEQH